MMVKSKFLLKAASLLCVLVLVLGLFAGCACNHDYVNGVCTKCERVCEHANYNDKGKCEECGIVCKHVEYDDGVCEECGVVCKHEKWNDGVCRECGTVCEHKEYKNGVCTVCRIVCKHEYTDGKCTICEIVCTHEYSNGVCQTCGYNCKHNYVKGSVLCTICKAACTHNYVGNTCSICGNEKFVTPDKPAASYDYAPHLDAQLPRIYVQSDTFLDDATKNVPSFDNYNPENNIDWQYHNCKVTVNNCDKNYELSSISAGIKVRGNWTTTYPKKPFRIKFDKKQAMLGLNGGAKMKSWVLLADYKDCALERNSAAFYLGQQILGSDGYYCSDFRQVELYLNNQYWGVYLLAEQQQTNENRINITEPEDGYLGTDIGYFIEYDGYYNLEVYGERFSSNHGNGYAIKSDVYENEAYPEYPAAGSDKRYPQKKFIQSYINNLYTICSDAVKKQYKTFNAAKTGLVTYKPTTSSPVYETVSKVIDVQSLVDMFIHCEIACDADIGWSSFFMDVDFGPEAKDNLLRFEAPWDFDSAFGLKVPEVADGNGIYAASRNPWLKLFMNESWFMAMVKNKWHEVHDAGVQQSTLQLIKTMQTNYTDAYNRNFDKWGFHVNGEATWQVQQSVKNHGDAVNQLYDWLNKRFSYLNSVWL